MALQFYNTASRKKEVFTLPEGVPAVRMYCCGPTVYHFAHIGNLRTYIFEDFLVRTLKYYGYKVNHIVNITDVGHLTSDADSGDDKMEKGAAREGKSVWDIAKFYTDAFMADWHRLNIQEPTRWTPATQHIQEQIELVKTLEEKGYTYRTSDGIYFDSLKFPRYTLTLHASTWKTCARVAASTWAKRRTPPTSLCGSSARRTRSAPWNGTARGALDSPAGTSNALPWP